MKNLGKQAVLCIALVDGKETHRATEKRVVYEDKQGQLWVNFLTSKRQIQREGDQLTWRTKITSIKAHTLPEIIERLSNPQPRGNDETNTNQVPGQAGDPPDLHEGREGALHGQRSTSRLRGRGG